MAGTIAWSPGWLVKSEGGSVAIADNAADWDAVQATLSGDSDAFGQIVRRYQRDVLTQMWRFTRDPGVQAELAQEAFIEAFRSLHTYRREAPFLHWLRRIATRTGYRHWKSKERDKMVREAANATALEVLSRPDDAEPSEAAECLHHLLDRLKPADRLVLTLIYFDGCDISDIADRMGWSPTLVRVRAHRARHRLRILLEQAGYGSVAP